jgi:hypothetical protein
MQITREDWLRRGVKKMEPLLKAQSAELPENWMIGTMEPRKTVIGRAWPAQHDTHQMFVSVGLTDSVQVLGVALHEMIHIAVGCDQGHRGMFAKVARGVGLKGKLTATTVEEGTDLHAALADIVDELGDFPNKALVPIKKAAAGSKWIRLESTNDSRYTVVISPKSLEACGAPVDPWGDEMVPR